MRHRVPRLLQQIVVAGIPVAAAGCVEAVIDNDCVDTVERSYSLATPASPPLQLKIERCRLDTDACTDLCREAMEMNNVPMKLPTRCEVVFHDASIDINVSFEVTSDRSDCPADGDVVFLSLSLSDGPQVRGFEARTFDTIWNGGRTCHA